MSNEVDNRAGRGVRTVQADELVEFVAEALAAGWKKHALKSRLETELGMSIHIATYETLLRRARELLLATTKVGRDEHLAESLEFYRSITRDPHAKQSDKINARKQIDKIIGLEVIRFEANNEDLAAKLRQTLQEMTGTVPDEPHRKMESAPVSPDSGEVLPQQEEIQLDQSGAEIRED